MTAPQTSARHSFLGMLEAEAIHILREGGAEDRNAVIPFSAGKDSTALAHLALRALYPAQPPFPLLHVDPTQRPELGRLSKARLNKASRCASTRFRTGPNGTSGPMRGARQREPVDLLYGREMPGLLMKRRAEGRIEHSLSMGDARAPIEEWRAEYNRNRPHSALGGLTPTEFAVQLKLGWKVA